MCMNVNGVVSQGGGGGGLISGDERAQSEHQLRVSHVDSKALSPQFSSMRPWLSAPTGNLEKPLLPASGTAPFF